MFSPRSRNGADSRYFVEWKPGAVNCSVKSWVCSNVSDNSVCCWLVDLPMFWSRDFGNGFSRKYRFFYECKLQKHGLHRSRGFKTKLVYYSVLMCNQIALFQETFLIAVFDVVLCTTFCPCRFGCVEPSQASRKISGFQRSSPKSRQTEASEDRMSLFAVDESWQVVNRPQVAAKNKQVISIWMRAVCVCVVPIDYCWEQPVERFNGPVCSCMSVRE